MEEKFDYFFSEFKKFVNQLGFFEKKEHLLSERINEINFFEKKYDFAFSVSLKSYLKYFGKGVWKKNYRIGLPFSIDSIDYATSKAKKTNLIKVIYTQKETDTGEKNPFYNGEKEVVFLQYYEMGDNCMFIEQGGINPRLYLAWESGEVTKLGHLTTGLRGSFRALWQKVIGGLTIYENDKKEFEKIKSETKLMKVPWISFYNEIYKSAYRKKIILKLPTWQSEYLEKFAHEEECQLLGVDEYEVEFIKYLIESKGIPYTPEVFDPYKPVVVFKDYLNDVPPTV